MPKTFEEREAKRCNRMGVPVEFDLIEAADVCPEYRKTRHIGADFRGSQLAREGEALITV